jgi:hypothetical protein
MASILYEVWDKATEPAEPVVGLCPSFDETDVNAARLNGT